jgi:hypothetical protein
MASARRLVARYRRHRFALLFAALLLGIAGHSLLGRLFPAANPLDWIIMLALVGVILDLRRGRMRTVMLVAIAGFVLSRLVQPLLPHPAPLLVGQSLLALVALLGAGVAARRALMPGDVDSEHICAALDAYLLVGLAFGVGYWLLEASLPGSFTPAADGSFSPQRAIYFSFVTQATLGYGDVSPLRPESQGVVIAQAIGGQMYLAVLVARLVSLYSGQKR